MSKLSKLSDEQVVELVRTQDKELYQEIMKRYLPRLTRYANYLINDPHQAEDAVQQGFIKAYVNLNSFNSKRQFSSWIYRIVHNEVINLVKKNKLEVDIDTQFSLASHENIEDEYVRAELAQATQHCLTQLPIIYREPMTLYFIDGYSYKEISDILRLPINTIGVRLSRGKKYLKDICQKQTQ